MHIGFCGIGFMGAPMVRRLLAAGYEVHIWNRTRQKCMSLETAGAIVEPTPAELAATCDIVCLCLLDSTAVETVVFGPAGIAEVQNPRWLIDHSSISPEATRAFSQRLAETNGAHWIDAPVSGGVPGAEAGTLAIMAGGTAEALADVRPILQAYASRITHMGPSGAGQVTKLCNQIIVAANVLAVAEAIGLAEGSGIAADRLPEALGGGLADSRLFQIFAARMLSPSTVKTGALSTMLKDIDTVISLGENTDTVLPMTTAVQNMLKAGLANGQADMDLWEVIKIYRNLNHQAE